MLGIMPHLRILRPSLSLRYQQLRHSSISKTRVEDVVLPPRPTVFRRNRGRLVWTVSALGAGVICGNFIVHTVAPPALPDAGTHGDKVLMADLNQRIDEDFKVKVLRGKCLGVSAQLKGNEGGWVELIKEEDQTPNLRSALAGAKALGVERVFWNRQEEKLVAIVWFGGSISGWPGITHGGVIATQFIEKIGLLAALTHGRHGDAATTAQQSLPGTGNHAKMLLSQADIEEPEELSLSYVKPTYANGFYVVRVSTALPLDTDPTHVIPEEPAGGKHDYEAVMESMDARILVKAKAKIAKVSQIEKLENEAKESVKWTSDQFKQWMWPSRQSALQE